MKLGISKFNKPLLKIVRNVKFEKQELLEKFEGIEERFVLEKFFLFD